MGIRLLKIALIKKKKKILRNNCNRSQSLMVHSKRSVPASSAIIAISNLYSIHYNEWVFPKQYYYCLPKYRQLYSHFDGDATTMMMMMTIIIIMIIITTLKINSRTGWRFFHNLWTTMLHNNIYIIIIILYCVRSNYYLL